MPRRNRRRFIGDDRPRPRDPQPVDPARHIVAGVGAVALYGALVWFGVRIVGDTMGRSVVIAFLIVTIAGVGYWFTRQDPPRA